MELGQGWFHFALWLPVLMRRLFRALTRSTITPDAREKDASSVHLSEIFTLYINLDRRSDRRQLIEKELASAGFRENKRIVGVPNPLGILGCTKSHIAALTEIEQRTSALTVICEDDLEILVPSSTLESLISEFIQAPHLDVLCLAYRLRGPRIAVSKNLAIANNIQTTACYVVKARAIQTLAKSFRESEELLERGIDPKAAALDIHWKKVQSGELLFCIPRKPVARQRPSFSDIVGSVKDYGIS